MYVTYVVRCDKCDVVTGICFGGFGENHRDGCWLSRAGEQMRRDEALKRLGRCQCEKEAA